MQPSDSESAQQPTEPAKIGLSANKRATIAVLTLLIVVIVINLATARQQALVAWVVGLLCAWLVWAVTAPRSKQP